MNKGCFFALSLLAASVQLTFAGELLSTDYNVSFQLLEEPRNPRLSAMGSAGTAQADRGFYYYNPAMAAVYASRYLGLEFGRNYGELNASAVETGLRLKEWSLALAIPTATLDGIIPASEQNRALHATFAWQTTVAAVALGYRKERVSGALCLYGLQERIGTERAYGISMSAGLLVDIIPGNLRVGAAGFYPAFLTATTGMLDNKKDLGAGTDLAQLARIGAAWNDSIGSLAYTAALDIAYNYDIGTICVPLGLEVIPIEFLALRIGSRLGHDTDRFSFGLGLLYRQLRFDSAVTLSRFIDDTQPKWLLGLSYAIR